MESSKQRIHTHGRPTSGLGPIAPHRRTVRREVDHSQQCAACGSRFDLRAVDEAGYVYFCAECRDAADPDDLFLDLGGGD